MMPSVPIPPLDKICWSWNWSDSECQQGERVLRCPLNDTDQEEQRFGHFSDSPFWMSQINVFHPCILDPSSDSVTSDLKHTNGGIEASYCIGYSFSHSRRWAKLLCGSSNVNLCCYQQQCRRCSIQDDDDHVQVVLWQPHRRNMLI